MINWCALTASGLPLALREDVNFGNIDGEPADGLEATDEEQVFVDAASLVPIDEDESLEAESANDDEDADKMEPESEGAEAPIAEWDKDASEVLLVRDIWTASDR
uniref:Uncharacterized protein n=1 Tax=Tetranychus urticae TaxID=32264 RepID=T1KHQ6_TETUR